MRLNEHLEHPDGLAVFQHACKMGLEGIVSKRLGSRYRSGRSPDWLKFKNPEAPAVKREAEEEWRPMSASTIYGAASMKIARHFTVRSPCATLRPKSEFGKAREDARGGTDTPPPPKRHMAQSSTPRIGPEAKMTRGRENRACSITETGKRADLVRMLPWHHS